MAVYFQDTGLWASKGREEHWLNDLNIYRHISTNEDYNYVKNVKQYKKSKCNVAYNKLSVETEKKLPYSAAIN